jgi:hypothetical protein
LLPDFKAQTISLSFQLLDDSILLFKLIQSLRSNFIKLISHLSFQVINFLDILLNLILQINIFTEKSFHFGLVALFFAKQGVGAVRLDALKFHVFFLQAFFGHLQL